jgi:hypothetical protein
MRNGGQQFELQRSRNDFPDSGHTLLVSMEPCSEPDIVTHVDAIEPMPAPPVGWMKLCRMRLPRQL